MGTNYGGFVASMVMAQTDLVRCGVFTSPVTDWIHYGKMFDKLSNSDTTF